MHLRTFLLAACAAATAGCGTTATVLPPPTAYPGAPEWMLDPGNCPDADPKGPGVLHDPVDGTVPAVLEAHKLDGRMYVGCRTAHEALIQYERQRMQAIRERAMQKQ